MSDILSEDEISSWHRKLGEFSRNPAAFEYRGIPVGDICRVSLCWIIGRENLDDSKETVEYYKRMVLSACMLIDAFDRLFAERRPDHVFVFNGLFYPEWIARLLAERAAIPVTVYEAGLRGGTLVLTHGPPPGWYEIDDRWPELAALQLTPEENDRLDSYLLSRKAGGGDVRYLWPSMDQDPSRIRERLSLPTSGRIIVAFTNVAWDTAVVGRNTIFPSMKAWLKATVELFREELRQDTLVIRVHPGEVRLWTPTAEPVEGMFDRETMPPNVRIVGPSDDVSSYELLGMSDLNIVYSSTIGLEAAVAGRTVVVAGKTHFDGKGFTITCQSPKDYRTNLRAGALPTLLDSDAKELARRYAYAQLFRNHLEFPWATLSAPGEPRIALQSPCELGPDGDPEFELLCRAVFETKDVLELRLEQQDPGSTVN
jgi:hypothetical protein